MLVSDIYEEVQEVTGKCDPAINYQAINRAIQLLANKGLFDPLIGYFNFTNTTDGAYYAINLVALPRDVKAVLRVTINTKPSWSRDKFFEFLPNSEGSGDGEEIGYSWQDRAYSPIQLQSGLPANYLYYTCASSDDTGKTIAVWGRDLNGRDAKDTIAADTIDGDPPQGTVAFSLITRVQRQATVSQCTLTTDANRDLAKYYHDETDPMYRVIKLSKAVKSVRVMYRKQAFAVSSMSDLIPIDSGMAVIHAAKAVRYFAIDEYEKGDAALARAVQFLKEEQASREEQTALASAMELAPIIQRDNFNVREGVMVADVYDEASDIFGYVGRPKLLEQINGAVQLLANKAQWDSMTAVVTLTSDANGWISLPRQAYSPLAINISNGPAMARSRLFEFSLNTNGSETGEIVGANWELRDENPLFVDPATPSVINLSGSAGDDGLIFTISGYDANGIQLTESVTFAHAGVNSANTYKSLVSVVKPVTTGFVTVKDAGAVVLAKWYPDEMAPMYRRVRISKLSTQVRVLYKRRATGFMGLFDLIPLRSRDAVVNAMRSLKAFAVGDNQKAKDFMDSAVMMLQEDMASSTVPSGDQVLTATDTTIRGELLIVGDIYDEAAGIFGPVGRTKIYDSMTDSIQILANKGAWDSMTAIVNIMSDADGYATLPRFAHAPLAININLNPAFNRSRLFEFDMNTNGTESGEQVGFSWANLGETPVHNQPSTHISFEVIHVTGNAADNALALQFTGLDASGNEVSESILVNAVGSVVFASISQVVKPVTAYAVTVKGNVTNQIYSVYYPDEIYPSYRRLRVSKPSAALRVLFKKRSPKIAGMYDLIPLKSRQAVISAMRAVKAWADGSGQAGDSYMAMAVGLLKEEMDSVTVTPLDGVITPTDSSVFGELVIASDIYDEAASIFGKIGRQKLFDRMTDAAAMLANKAQWDSMTATVLLSSDANGFVSLPRFVHEPLAININGNPAFSRSRLFEYSLNTNGTETGEQVGWNWAFGEESPVFLDIATPGTLTIVSSDGGDDVGIVVTFTGLSGSGVEVSEAITIGSGSVTGTVSFAKVLTVSKPATTGILTVSRSTTVIATYYPDETTPNYRRLRVSKPSSNLKVIFRKRSPRISSMFDFIPLRSRQAIVNAMRALSAYDAGNTESADALIASAVGLLTDEMKSAITPALDQALTAIDTGTYIRDGVVVSDVYDMAAEIFGPIGRTKLFDRMTMAIEVLRNKAHWDCEVGMVDIWLPDRSDVVNVQRCKGSGLFTLPRFVEAVISLNICGEPGVSRNRWYEFHLNGNGERNRAAHGKWDDVGETCIIQDLIIDPDTRLVIPVKVSAICSSSADNGVKTTLYGFERYEDGTEGEVYRNGVPGYQITANATLPTPAGDAPNWVRIDRIKRDVSTDFVRLVSWDSGSEGMLLGHWYPDETEPKYRKIKVHTEKAKRIRVMYRKRFQKITSLFQPIQLRSRLAIENMMRSIQMQPTDQSTAQMYEQIAVNYLSEERINSSPSEMPTLQFDRSSMPGFTGNVM